MTNVIIIASIVVHLSAYLFPLSVALNFLVSSPALQVSMWITVPMEPCSTICSFQSYPKGLRASEASAVVVDSVLAGNPRRVENSFQTHARQRSTCYFKRQSAFLFCWRFQSIERGSLALGLATYFAHSNHLRFIKNILTETSIIFLYLYEHPVAQ